MQIEHLAVWVRNLELCRAFFEKYFDAEAGEKYHNPGKNFTSYFLRFSSGSRLELMHNPEIKEQNNSNTLGLAHFAISLGSKEMVDQLTSKLSRDGYEVSGQPRTTGDGYYESVIRGPENLTIELTV